MKKAIADSFNIRKRKLKELGFSNYREYMKSDLWKNLRSEIYDSKDRCECCGSKDRLQVHHSSYTFMATDGVGRTKGLILLCDECHKKVHRKSESSNIGLVKATKLVLASRV